MEPLPIVPWPTAHTVGYRVYYRSPNTIHTRTIRPRSRMDYIGRDQGECNAWAGASVEQSYRPQEAKVPRALDPYKINRLPYTFLKFHERIK